MRSYRGQPQRRLTSDDVDSFVEAATLRKEPRTTAQARAAIRQSNPVRWWRLQGDLKWLRREMKRMGLNPEDARWIL